ncbi:hypothetical protein BHM03_00030006, partial [Ensete ventricosum]
QHSFLLTWRRLRLALGGACPPGAEPADGSDNKLMQQGRKDYGVYFILESFSESWKVVVEEWSRPELQAFHLHSPPHPSSADQDVPQEELLVIEVAERGSGGVAGPVAAASGGAMSPFTTVSSSAAPGLEMEATNGNIKVEEPPVPPPSAAAAAAPAAAGSGSQEDKKPAPPSPTVGFGELFRFADGLDCVLMSVGTAGAIVHGCSLPIFLRFFANLVNSFGSNTGDPDTMVREVVKVLPPSPSPSVSSSTSLSASDLRSQR